LGRYFSNNRAKGAFHQTSTRIEFHRRALGPGFDRQWAELRNRTCDPATRWNLAGHAESRDRHYTSIDLLPAVGSEPKPYAEIDTKRYFTATASTPKLYTTEGVYGVCARGATQFAEPPDRTALMQTAFGSPVVGAGIFAAREMPHGLAKFSDL
jgi:hypothetical protein